MRRIFHGDATPLPSARHSSLSGTIDHSGIVLPENLVMITHL
jgi:hypothetical protein